MKTRLLWIIGLQLISVMALAQSGTFDVRKVRWWMSPQQVMASEVKKPAERSQQRIVYENVKVGDDWANLLYEFDSNKLVSLTYTFTKLGGILYLPYISYSAINRKITGRNGEPVEGKEKWKGNKDAYEPVIGYSDAVIKGDLVLSTTWISKRTEIIHIMNDELHGLSYTSRLTPKPAPEESKDF